ncbi:hypothetical protein BKK54_03140 [Rodentibacter genomosp. 1]|uniref:AP2/ERF domain-containing protein n=1 Tax=Rodentibacter genomosp. 1 TaxID=1908264 RepID=A0A1V3J802_9PAST|nr:hypothetical protein [Rodentibacter genomosp. 1]OOF51421.1 hypothetical protein BKK54_03140 [Rodentibacter genomosp. 1]
MTEDERTSYIAKLGSTGFRGVRTCNDTMRPRFMAQIVMRENGQKVYYKTARFDTALEAAIAYDKLAKQIHKEKAVTNKDLGLIHMGREKELSKDKVMGAIWETVNLCDRLKRISQGFCEHLSTQRNTKGKFIEFEKISKINIPQNEVVKIIEELSAIGLIIVEESTRNYPPKLWHVKIQINAYLARKIKVLREKHKQEKKMAQEINLTDKSPEELLAMAEELKKLSEAKKQEIANGDVIKKTLRPLVLNAFQAKGKFERKLNELLDVSTELDNALNALRDAMK